ncbi:hypothetical protein JG687_00005993 [Phytophthora cactorum]|uniref:Uncharacterized protein n=1 Tax=Phytophthora cactorum TaxID=29920 RepID=A0A8T1ULL3_9STRA|nr:hypothetical protein JG687_00005993 [Phytophthora cactorum]
MVPVFACTTEKLQGQTCHDVIAVTPLNPRRAIPFHTFYVALSRAVCLTGLALTEKITRQYIEYSTLAGAIVAEMQRLIDLVKLPPAISMNDRIAFRQWKATQHV